MASSGVQVEQECIQAYQDLQLNKKLQYIVYRISDDKKSIVVDQTSPINKEADSVQQYESFISSLPKDCRWIVYDFHYTYEGSQRNKVIFISWSPDDGASIKSKMLYSSSRDAIRQRLAGVHADIQATDLAEASFETVLGRLKNA
ncbi:hypothetical protein B0O80DRAFT_452932 [Mortierella sp. GBAus27b]|nr:cofilin [Mortierella sp. GBA43]KAI8353025.1 hypothetical protein B0O80DRAFT_452932 [Mortierella sp. GBAus27b]